VNTLQTGEIIGNLAKEQGINLHQLSIKAGVPYNTLYAIVKRKSSRVDTETQIKIAKALGVHLQDLSDSSWLEEIDRQLGPEKLAKLRENAAQYGEVRKYLEEMGFTISEHGTMFHYEEADVKTFDESEIVLSKDGHTAAFTDAEFQELLSVAKAGAKEAIEGKFYKKVLEQQKK